MLESVGTVPLAIGAALVAGVVGYIVLSPKKASAAPPKPAPKTTPKPSGGGGGGGGASVSKKKNWKLLGYQGGLAQGKADKARGQPFFLIPSRVVSGEKMPATPGASTSDPVAVADWTTGYADGYPVGYGKVGSTAPKYATESTDESGGGGEIGDMSYTDGPAPDESTTSDSSSSESDSTTETSGASVSTGLLIAVRNARSPGAWGTRNDALARVRSVRRKAA